MSNHAQDMKRLIAAVSGQANMLSIPKAYIDYTGSLEAALLLSQIVFWSDRTDDEEGWFYKTYQDWEKELTLSKYCVNRHVKRFEAVGILGTKVKKVNGNPTLHYRLDWDTFSLSLVEFLNKPTQSGLQDSVSEETQLSKVKKLDERKSKNLTIQVSEETQLTKVEKPIEPLYLQRSHSKITSEITSIPEAYLPHPPPISA